MPRYLVRSTVDTPACVCAIKDLPNPDAPRGLNFDMQYADQVLRVSITDEYSSSDDLPQYVGLVVDVECNAPDAKAATVTALNHADLVLSWMSLVTASYVGIPKLRFVYDITGDISVRQYIFHVPVEHARHTIQRSAPQESMAQIFLAFGEQQVAAGSLTRRQREGQTALARAVRWIRKGLGEDDALDAFLHFWTALESLEHVLPRSAVPPPPMICNSCGTSFDPCPSCGRRSGARASSSPLLAIRDLCERSGIDSDHFLVLRDLRAAMLHSRSALSGGKDGVVERVKEELPVVRSVAIAGICEGYSQFGLPTDWAARIIPLTPISQNYETWLRFTTRVGGINDFHSDGTRITPEMRVTQKLVDIFVEGPVIKVRGQFSLTPSNCSIVGEYEVELWSLAPLDAGSLVASE